MYRPVPPPIRIVVRPQWGRLVLFALFALAPLGGTALAALDARAELALRTRGVTTGAWVVATRPAHREVRYRFTVPGSSARYSRGEATGRGDLWSELPATEFDQALASGRLAVVYLPDNPWANRPAAVAPGAMPLGDPLAAGVLCALVSLILTVLPFVDRARCRRQLTSGSPQVAASLFWRGYREIVPAE